MTDAEKCCAVLDYLGYEADNYNDVVWISVWNRELTETTDFKLSRDEVANQASEFDAYYKLHESFRKWLEESQTLVRLVQVCDECGYVDDEVASHYEECSKLNPENKEDE